MPTKDGDVIILHKGRTPADHVLWRVMADGQQEPSPFASTVVVKTGREAARALALRIARMIHRRVFYVEPDCLTWTEVSED